MTIWSTAWGRRAGEPALEGVGNATTRWFVGTCKRPDSIRIRCGHSTRFCGCLGRRGQPSYAAVVTSPAMPHADRGQPRAVAGSVSAGVNRCLGLARGRMADRIPGVPPRSAAHPGLCTDGLPGRRSEEAKKRDRYVSPFLRQLPLRHRSSRAVARFCLSTTTTVTVDGSSRSSGADRLAAEGQKRDLHALLQGGSDAP